MSSGYKRRKPNEADESTWWKSRRFEGKHRVSHSLVRVRGNRTAFGQPGTAPRWSPVSKDGVGTAYATSSRLWFTLWNGIVTEVYFPTVDRPQIRDQATDAFRLRWSDDQWQTMRDTIVSSTALV